MQKKTSWSLWGGVFAPGWWCRQTTGNTGSVPLVSGLIRNQPDPVLAFPIIRSGTARSVAIPVAGVRSHMLMNDANRDFYDMVTSSVTSAVSNARARKKGRRSANAPSRGPIRIATKLPFPLNQSRVSHAIDFDAQAGRRRLGRRMISCRPGCWPDGGASMPVISHAPAFGASDAPVKQSFIGAA